MLKVTHVIREMSLCLTTVEGEKEENMQVHSFNGAYTVPSLLRWLVYRKIGSYRHSNKAH